MNKTFYKQWVMTVFAVMASTVVYAQSPAQAPAQHISPARVQQEIYAQCMKTLDTNLPAGQQKYCACSSQKIAAQMSASDLASAAASAGKNASQDDIGKSLMSDSRFMAAIQQCLTAALGGK